MKKLETADKEIPIEERVNFFGERDSKNLVVSWGSPKGAIIESIGKLAEEGFSLGFLQVRMLHPLPKEYVANVLGNAEKIITVENNFSGQLAEMIKEKTGISTDFRVLKYNGRPMTTTEVYAALKNILLGQASERQVLTYGS
jgi:2-oxoglutarate ferredoxin oxidoreductase subunit alpha